MEYCHECGRMRVAEVCEPDTCSGQSALGVSVKDRWLEVRPWKPADGSRLVPPATIAVCDPATGRASVWDWEEQRYGSDVAAVAGGEASFAWIEVTTQCNQTCRHCFMFERLRQGHVPLEQLVSAICALERLPVRRLVLSGGEPTLHPNFHEVLAAALRAVRPVTVLSNGLRHSATLISALRHPLVRVEVPLLGWEEAHDHMTGVPGSFQRALAALKAYREAGVRVVMTTTLTRYGYEALPRLKTLAETLGVPLEPSRLFPEGAAVANWEELAPGQEPVMPGLKAQQVPA